MFRTSAGTRYRRRAWIAALAYAALVAVSALMKMAFSPPPLLVAAVAVASALPIIGLIALLGLYLREETDEYVRNRLILSMLLALGVVLSLSSVFGMLQFGGLVGDLPVFLAFVVWACAWGVAKTWLAWRDQRQAAGS